ncbi:hypothetical protein SteCoe_37640 [Stentor coeruleus]|uniref:Uncharacterized protein n=1 Tax=Stentor coeruleus TaxID=5963 RepID=A0A1R2AMK8_9CILI|nr:hypothetical protein SteCoe_37640 [Stentor coeruleus]
MTPFNPTKKTRMDNGNEKPSFGTFMNTSEYGNCPNELSYDSECHRVKFKAHHKCKHHGENDEKNVYQFKAKPMPNFSKPFVPKHFKNNTTQFQEFNLSCYTREVAKSNSVSRCDTPCSMFSSVWSQQSTDSLKQFMFKARPMPDFSNPTFNVLGKGMDKLNRQKNFDYNKPPCQEPLNMDIENTMDLDL